MKTLAYDEDTLDLLNSLKRQTPKRITSDEYSVSFDYGDFHIVASPEDFEAASQNDFDEVIRVKFERVDSSLQLGELEKVLFQNTAIDRIWILRTVLYFTNHETYNSEEEALGDFQIESETDEILAETLRKCTGGHQEIVCHPTAAKDEKIDPEFSNLVDAGIMLEIDEHHLMCFSHNNSFFSVGRVMSVDELKTDVIPYYEFVEI